MTDVIKKARAAWRAKNRDTCSIALAAFSAAFVLCHVLGAQPAYAASSPNGALQVPMMFSAGTDQARGAFKIIVESDGKRTAVFVAGETVERVLERMDITLGSLDTVEPALNERVEKGQTLKVTRREYVVREEEEILPFPIVARTSPDVKAGQEEIYVAGQTGLAVTSYKCLLVDGVVAEQTLIGREVRRAPVTQEMLIGFRSIPISKLNFEWDFDENAEPIGYAMVLRDQRSTGYSARAGALTASGRAAVVGHVAVNPNVIPYGSRLFIQSSDGKYIYGYAIAADTGGAMLSGRVALDCFYDTYEASANHGVKTVDIFVLD
jgi:Uncharacterized protein conserved in bacteria